MDTQRKDQQRSDKTRQGTHKKDEKTPAANYSAKSLPPLEHGRRHFLHLDDFTGDELLAMLDTATDVKQKLAARDSTFKPFKEHTLAMVFTKPSLRTRVSFEVGFERLGGHAMYLSNDEHKIGQREPVKDLSRVLSRYVDAVMARLHAHEELLEMAATSSVPVVNGLTDHNHPCQVLGDVMTIREHLGKLEGVRIAWVGDGNNIVHSLLRLACVLPIDLAIACLEGYEPDASLVKRTKDAGKSKVSITNDPAEAVSGADVVYTDVWASMGQKEEAEERHQKFRGFTVSDELLAKAKPGVLFLHCLPAQRGEEVTDEVMEGKHSMVFDQAENRMHSQMAVLLHCMNIK